jgi:DnaJ-class molecular chaperone
MEEFYGHNMLVVEKEKREVLSSTDVYVNALKDLGLSITITFEGAKKARKFDALKYHPDHYEAEDAHETFVKKM